MLAVRVGVGIGVATAHMYILNIQDDMVRSSLGVIWPCISFTVWQIVIIVVARHHSKRAEQRATARAVNTLSHGEPTLDLILDALGTSDAHPSMR